MGLGTGVLPERADYCNKWKNTQEHPVRETSSSGNAYTATDIDFPRAPQTTAMLEGLQLLTGTPDAGWLDVAADAEVARDDDNKVEETAQGTIS
jgi:hypothetical protein